GMAAGRSPPGADAPASAWNGFFVGAGIGEAWGETSFAFAGGLPANPNPFDFDSAVAGGLHIGYQRQWGHIVGGVETSVLFTNLGGRSTCPNPTFGCTVDASWIWMVGPRLGYATGALHFYGTGGYALGKLESKTVDLGTGAVFDTGHDQHD